MDPFLLKVVGVPLAILILIVAAGGALSRRLPSMQRPARRFVVGLALATCYILILIGVRFDGLPIVLMSIFSLAGVAIGFGVVLEMQQRQLERVRERTAACSVTEAGEVRRRRLTEAAILLVLLGLLALAVYGATRLFSLV